MPDEHSFNPNDPAHCDTCFKEGEARLRMEHVEHVHCSRCGKRCSGVDPELGLVVRAWVECPECIETSHHDAEARIADLEARVRFYEQHTDRQANELVATKVLCYRYAAKWRERAGWHKALAPKQCCEAASDDFQSVADGQHFQEHDAPKV